MKFTDIVEKVRNIASGEMQLTEAFLLFRLI